MEENDFQERGFQIEEIAWLKKKDKCWGIRLYGHLVCLSGGGPMNAQQRPCDRPTLRRSGGEI